jgi:hypothetical protein
MSKQQAHKILDALREGIWQHPVLVSQALIITGDMRWM